MFELEKHYFDAVEADGSLTIVYDCVLRIAGTLRWNYSSRQVASAHPTHCREFHGSASSGLNLGKVSVPGMAWPVAMGDGFIARWKVRQTGPGPVKLLSQDGALGSEIIWQCHAPICDVELGPAQRPATGYMETLRLRLPWPHVPIERLHWGRFIGSEQSLVWIVWEGPEPRRLAWFNGKEVDLSAFQSRGEDSVRSLEIVAGETRLDIADARAIAAPALDDRLRSTLGPLRHLLPRQLRAIEDRKALGNGTLVIGEGRAVRGTAVFESIDLAA